MKALLRGALLGAAVVAAGQIAGDAHGKAGVAASGTAAKAGSATAEATAKAGVNVRMSRLPLRFEANAGQWDPRVRFRARQGGATLFITDDGMTVGLTDVKPTHRRPGETPDDERKEREAALKDAKSAAVSIKLVGAKPSAPRGEQEIVTKSNFFIGNDPAKWRTNVPNYAQVRAKNWVPGVDVVWHGGANGLEYDLEVAAGVDARKIAFDVEGADSLRVNDEGALEIATTAGTLVQRPPRVVQDGRALVARYHVSGARRIALGLEAYDPASALFVDPVLTYSTYLGSFDNDCGYGITIDSIGNTYITGATGGGITNNFPTTSGAYQTTYGGAGNFVAFVTKLNAAGSALVYSTYIGGNSAYGRGVAVDSSGNAYVTGYTTGNFPTTTGAYQTTFGGGKDAFVAKLSATGSALSYSTYLGGSGNDSGFGITVDSSGAAYVTGAASAGFPTTAGAYQTACAGSFVAKFNAANSTLVYSTCLGSAQSTGIAVDSSGSAYVTGGTGGSFPTTTGAYQITYGGGGDAFVAKLNAGGSALVYSTYLGGSGSDGAGGIAVDSSNNAYVTGYTWGSFPTTTGAYQTTFGGGYDAFVAKLNASGSALSYSSYLGGSPTDQGNGVAVDSSGNVYVTGQTSGGFPTTTTGAVQATYGGGSWDAFVAKLNTTGSALSYSSYLGGSGADLGYGVAVDPSGNAYVTGPTAGGFPTTAGVYQTTYGGSSGDTFVAKISDPELSNATSCTQVGECGSGLCIDGVCCDKPCDGQCEACDVSGHEGACTPVTGAPHGSRTACQSNTTCTATCDGTNTTICTYGPDVCESTCSNGTEDDTLCDTTGGCTVKKSQSCNNLVCASEGDGGTCKTACMSNSDCQTNFACAADGTCQPGGACIDDHTMQSANNTTKDCAPYKCVGHTCIGSCQSVDDCVAPNVCDPSGQCVPPPSSGDNGCACDTSPSGPSWGATVLGLTVASLLTGQRRRRSASATSAAGKCPKGRMSS